MEATELRIGNIIDTGFGQCCVTGIRENGYVIDLTSDTIENGWVLINDTKPIPLTEEWLKSFGFDLDKYNGIGCIDSPNDKFHSLQKIGDCFYPYETDNVIPVKLEYVHELQNLYYAMTKSELVLAVAPPCP